MNAQPQRTASRDPLPAGWVERRYPANLDTWLDLSPPARDAARLLFTTLRPGMLVEIRHATFYKRLAAKNETTSRNAFQRLADLGIVRRHTRGRGRKAVNLYLLLDPVEAQRRHGACLAVEDPQQLFDFAIDDSNSEDVGGGMIRIHYPGEADDAPASGNSPGAMPDEFMVVSPANAAIETHLHQDDALIDDWRASPSETLARLLEPTTSRDELFDAILFAEVAAFDESQTKELLPRLFAFVREHRFSADDAVKTAVGAAIRKLATNLQDCQFEYYAELFVPTETDTLPCEIELELAKSILWRLTDTPSDLSQQFPKLETRVSELALDYLKPRLVLQKNYASVALHAALGALLLNGVHGNAVASSVNNLGIGWFKDLFQRRLGRLCAQLEKRSGGGSAGIVARLRRIDATPQANVSEVDTNTCPPGD